LCLEFAKKGQINEKFMSQKSKRTTKDHKMPEKI